MRADEYVSDEARYAQQVEDMSGVSGGHQTGMAPYPLYGVQGLGQEMEGAIPFYKRPMFCYPVGMAVGFGIGYLFFEWFKPKYMKANPSKKAKKSESSED